MDVQTSEKLCYSVPELGKALGIGRNGAYDLVHRDGFPVIKVGGKMIIPKAALANWLAEQTGHEVR